MAKAVQNDRPILHKEIKLVWYNAASIFITMKQAGCVTEQREVFLAAINTLICNASSEPSVKISDDPLYISPHFPVQFHLIL